jgi:hypothetical protein
MQTGTQSPERSSCSPSAQTASAQPHVSIHLTCCAGLALPPTTLALHTSIALQHCAPGAYAASAGCLLHGAPVVLTHVLAGVCLSPSPYSRGCGYTRARPKLSSLTSSLFTSLSAQVLMTTQPGQHIGLGAEQNGQGGGGSSLCEGSLRLHWLQADRFTLARSTMCVYVHVHVHVHVQVWQTAQALAEGWLR